MAAYAEAKKQIFVWQDTSGIVLLNRDDPEVAGWADQAPGRVVWFGARPEALQVATEPAVFYDANGIMLYAPEPQAKDRHLDLPRLCARSEIALVGRHNLANVAAAAALARSFGVEIEHIRNAIRNFIGVEHRLEFVRELDSVRFYNDTAATAPEAAIAALYSFERPIVLIAGGADKNLPFGELARAIVERAKAVVLLEGTATSKLQSAVSSQRSALGGEYTGDWRLATMVGPFGDFAQAVEAARELASPGDVVLLAPGCASFGMFRNEFHRGDEFKRIVHQL
jgi:UDP-N-acetylmuramoylalanine--D-glutamate ligase